MSLEDAIAAFAAGFAHVRSTSRPYLATAHGPLTVLADPPGARDPRRSEVVVLGVGPAEVRERVVALGIARHAASVVSADDGEFDEDVWREGGYRLTAREGFFVRSTAGVEPDPRVVRVDDPEGARWLAEGIESRRSYARVAADPAVRLYAARDEAGRVVGTVRSVRATPGTRWVSTLYVRPDARRRGFGAALMRTMLADDAAAGDPWSVLLASQAGAMLYPTLGYARIGTLRIYVAK